MEKQIIRGRNNIFWIKEGANYYKAIQHKEPVVNSDILDAIPDYQIMKEYKVEGWFRYDDEKDFITQTIHATTPAKAEQLFRSKYKRTFFKVDIDLL
jgi:hypothetical protein